MFLDVRDYFRASLATSEYENTSNMFFMTESDSTEKLLQRCEQLLNRLSNNKCQNQSQQNLITYTIPKPVSITAATTATVTNGLQNQWLSRKDSIKQQHQPHMQQHHHHQQQQEQQEQQQVQQSNLYPSHNNSPSSVITNGGCSSATQPDHQQQQQQAVQSHLYPPHQQHEDVSYLDMSAANNKKGRISFRFDSHLKITIPKHTLRCLKKGEFQDEKLFMTLLCTG